MANTYTSLDYHLIFSTKNREPRIRTEIESRIWSFMAGIAAKQQMVPKKIGGVADHVHLLLSIPPTIAVAKAVQLIKGGASQWINEEKVAGPGRFQWQAGYGAFTVSPSKISDTRAYIADQRRHHRHRTFQDEYREFLDRHDIDYDERYLWD